MECGIFISMTTKHTQDQAVKTAQPTHTPGPWKVRGCENEDFFPEVLIPSHFGDFDSICVNAGGWKMERHQANARLIAASPDLLQALKQALDAHAFDASWKKLAQVAIARAEGRE